MSSSAPADSSSTPPTDAPSTTPTDVPSTTPPPSTSNYVPATTFTQSTGDNGETQVLDDTDPSIIYTAPGTIPWNVTSDTNAYNHTLHESTSTSQMATLLFNGTGISLTSMLSPDGSLFIVILDGTSAGAYTLSSPTEQPAVVYTIENLQNQQHNATFMKASNDPNDQSIFNIDSITVITRPPLTGASFVPPTASGRTSATNTQTGASPTDSIAPISSASSPPPIGAIVGGTIGGILLIGVLIAWIILMRRRKSKTGETGEKEGSVYAEDRYADRYAAQDRRSQTRASQDRYAQPRTSTDKYANGNGYSREAYAPATREAYAGNTRNAYAPSRSAYGGNTREAYATGGTREAYATSGREPYASNTRDAYGRSSRDGYAHGRAVSRSSGDAAYPTAPAVSRSSRRY